MHVIIACHVGTLEGLVLSAPSVVSPRHQRQVSDLIHLLFVSDPPITTARQTHPISHHVFNVVSAARCVFYLRGKLVYHVPSTERICRSGSAAEQQCWSWTLAQWHISWNQRPSHQQPDRRTSSPSHSIMLSFFAHNVPLIQESAWIVPLLLHFFASFFYFHCPAT